MIDQVLDAGELWKADFDHPTDTSLNQLGVGSLGDTSETIQVQGDSGGPIFYDDGVDLTIAGTMTFGQDTLAANFPEFGSLAGGMIISNAYVTWFDSVIAGGGGGGGGGGGDKPCNPRKPGCATSAMSQVDAEIVLASDVTSDSAFTATPNTPRVAPAAVVSSLGSGATTQEVGFLDARAIVTTVDVSSESRELRVVEGFDSESDDSADLLFEAWPSSRETLLDDAVFSL